MRLVLLLVFALATAGVVLVSANAWASSPPVDPKVVEALLAIQPRSEAIPKSLAGAKKQADRKNYAAACKLVMTRHQALLRQAAPLFYQPDRRRGGDDVGLTSFLEHHLEGPQPELQMVAESLVPAPGVRALGIWVCLRAGLPGQAEVLVRDLALLHAEPQARLTLALLRAQSSGRWADGAAVLGPDQRTPRALLLRALAGEAPGAKALLEQASREAATPQEQQLAAQVSQLLGLAFPAPLPSPHDPASGARP